MARYLDSLTQFVTHPLDSLQSLFTPSTPVTSDLGGPISGYDALFGSGGDSLSSARVRSFGVDPSTGKLISDAYAPSAVAAGYKGNGQDFIDSVTSMVQSQYNADYAWSLSSGDGSGAGLSSSPLLWLLVVLVIVFLVLKVVK